MQLGVRAHDFGKLPLEELARRIAAKGFSSIQLALSKALPGMEEDVGKLSPGLAHSIGTTFARHNIQIAVLGCYINPIHPDPEIRRSSLARFKEHLRYARDFGCGIVGTETGSFHADFSFHPDNHSPKGMEMLLESINELVAEAEKFGVIVGLEGVTSYVASNPERIKYVLDTIGSNILQVIFDPVNLLDAGNYPEQEKIIAQSFALFGDRIAIVHAKDFILENGQKKTVIAGKGRLDWELLLRWLKTNKPGINILLEDTRPDTVDQSVAFIQGVYQKV